MIGAGFSGHFGQGAQAATVRISASAAHVAGRLDIRNPFATALRGMWVILLEIGLVIGLAAFIVWWTWPKKRDEGDMDGPDAERRREDSER